MQNNGSEPVDARAIRGCGTYILVIRVGEDQDTVVGSLGTVRFRAGYYLYVGSALAGLGARLARHLCGEKAFHWHIDYLLARGRIEEIWYQIGCQRLECTWARALEELPGVSAFPSRFGASDCRCRTHLFCRAARPDFRMAQDRLGATHLVLMRPSPR